MSATTIDSLRESLAGPTPKSRAYAEKMLHALPPMTEVTREAFVLERVTGKRVYEFGASGPLQAAIREVAAGYCGVDREAADAVIGFDLDDVSQRWLPWGPYQHEAPDLIVCGEVLEHLSNPGWFLARLRRQFPQTPVLITVPNAFSEGGRQSLRRGVENVNKDHVAYYSWKTLDTLLTRHGYRAALWHVYNGTPGVAEGLVVVTE